jgi:hypothetical protein
MNRDPHSEVGRARAKASRLAKRLRQDPSMRFAINALPAWPEYPENPVSYVGRIPKEMAQEIRSRVMAENDWNVIAITLIWEDASVRASHFQNSVCTLPQR